MQRDPHRPPERSSQMRDGRVGGNRLVQLALVPQYIPQVVAGLDVGWPQLDGRTVAGRRLLQPSQVAECVSQVETCLGIIGVKGRGCW